MGMLNQDATVDQMKDFLLFHIDNADERKSKVNPSLTKKQVWDINMGAVLGNNIARISNIVIKNITREFGKYYEGVSE